MFACALFILCFTTLRSASSLPDAFTNSQPSRKLLQDAPEVCSSPGEGCGDNSTAAGRICGLCLFQNGTWRRGNTYNDPSALRTQNATECCHHCKADDCCVAWSRDRLTGACALKDQISDGFSDSRYESSAEEDRDITARAAFTTVEALEHTPRSECYMELGVAYLRGSVLHTTTTRSYTACCELCRTRLDCFSWHRNARTRRCILNRNIPTSSRVGSHFAGAASI